MKFVRTLYLLLSLIPFFGVSQTVYLDSLHRVYDESVDPLTRLELLRLITADEPDTDQKIAYAFQMEELANRLNLDEFRHAAKIQLGIGYRFKGDLASSLEHLLIGLEIAEKNDNINWIGSSIGEIAATYASQGDVRRSVQSMNRAIEIFRQQKDTLHLTIALLNTGYDYYTLNELDSSILYGKEAEQLISNYSGISSRRRVSLLAYIRGNMGITQAALGQKREAIEALLNSIESLRSMEDYYGVADFMKFLGEVQYEQGQLLNAELNALEALEITERFGLSELNRDLNLLLFRIYESNKNYQKALKHHLSYIKLADSIQNKQVIREMADQKAAFEVAQKESEVALLQAQRKNQQAVIVIATVVVFAFAVLIIVIFVYYRSKIRVNRMLQRQKASLERLNETKDKFFSIISHDLRGPISSLMGVSHLIRHFVEEKNEEQLHKMADHMEMSVNQLTTLLDNLLNWAMQQQGHFPNVPEKVEINSMMGEIVSMFSNMAAGKKIDIRFDGEGEIDLWVDRNSVHTIFRNLINNAIKFTSEGGKVSANSTIEGDFAVIRVADNGVGISKTKLNEVFHLSGERSTYGTAGEKGLGLGLQLVKEFVQMNGGKIDVDSAEGKGTTFIVKLPLFDAVQVSKEKATV